MNYGTIGKDTWQDPFFGDLTPKERYFYIYLCTCPQGQMCGVWPFNKRLAAAETGYNEETIVQLIDRMIDNLRVQYDQDTREILLTGWGDRNAGLFRSTVGKKENSTVTKIKQEMLKIRNTDFKRQVEQWVAGGATGGAPPVDGTGNINTYTETVTETKTPPTPTTRNGDTSKYTTLSPILNADGYDLEDIAQVLRDMEGRKIFYPLVYARKCLDKITEEKAKKHKDQPDLGAPTAAQTAAMEWFDLLPLDMQNELTSLRPLTPHDRPGGMHYPEWCRLARSDYLRELGFSKPLDNQERMAA